jgi:hypothetical protein
MAAGLSDKFLSMRIGTKKFAPTKEQRGWVEAMTGLFAKPDSSGNVSLFAAPSGAECCFGEGPEITRAFGVSS